METKSSHPGNYLKNASPIVQAYFEFNQLKLLFRQGWLSRGVGKAHCETVAEHSLGVVLLATWLADSYFPQLDTLKMTRMALFHDMGEIFVGDLTPAHGVDPDEKQAKEREAVIRFFEKLPNGQAYIDIWEAYEAQSCPESRFIRQIDRLEMGLQAAVYEHAHGLDLHEFFNSAMKVLDETSLRECLENAIKERVKP